MVEELLNKAAASSFNVFRFWGFLDIGNQGVSNSVDGNPRAKSFKLSGCLRSKLSSRGTTNES